MARGITVNISLDPEGVDRAMERISRAAAQGAKRCLIEIPIRIGNTRSVMREVVQLGLFDADPPDGVSLP